MSDDPLDTSVQFLPGVGPQRAGLLEKLDLRTARDLLFNLPRDVLDLTDLRRVSDLEEGSLQTIRGVVVDVDGRNLANGKTLSAVLLDCDGENARGVWFNQTWVLKRFRHNETVLFSGKPKRRSGRWEFPHPEIQWLDEEMAGDVGAVLPRYGLTEGLKMHELQRIIRQAAEQFSDQVPEKLPAKFLNVHNLLPVGRALRQLHLPQSMEEYHAGRRRLIFDDLFEFQLGLALRRRAWKKEHRAAPLHVTAKLDARIRRLFPFELTDGQNRAVQEITADLAANHAMHRLLQADVGAGKTAIALYAVLVAVAAGSQAVLMAPTEVLARQHWDTVERALSHSRVNRLLLTGHLTAKQRGRALKQISDGTAQLIVGTQAVIQKDVVFHKLGLVVIDEQHKFGVEQRARFSAGETSPHVLVMTATPIPRSLSMTQFGDLEITTISELPPGRQPVVTSRATAEGARKRVWGFLRKQLRAGRQAYVICPRIEADRSGNENQPEPEIDPDREIDPDDIVATEFSEESTVDHSTGSESTGAEHVFRQLQAEELKDFRVGLVHGQLEREQKAVAMDAFRAGETQVLVSTTVVEIGVDVPNATLMVILGAERFGLSQLHQLRGRTARGQFQGYCFLFSDADGPDAARRLHAMETLSDGFRIAETDFELRGPGDVLGTRQHGLLPLKVANLTRDGEILEESRTIAFDLVNSGEFDRPHFAPLKIEVLERFGRLMDLHHTG